MAPGQKKKKKVVVKVIKRKSSAKKDEKPKPAAELGSGTPHEPTATVPEQTQAVSAAEAFDHYAVSCGNLDKHRLLRQHHHLDSNLVSPTEAETQPATLPGTVLVDTQEPAQPELMSETKDMPAHGTTGEMPDVTSRQKPEGTTGEKPDMNRVEKPKPDGIITEKGKPDGTANEANGITGEKPDGTIGEKPGNSTAKMTTGRDDQAAGEAGDGGETKDEWWHGEWTSWSSQEPWSWEQWTDYGSWGSSTWSGDYWKGDYRKSQSFDSQRSDMTSLEWVAKTFDREDTQDFEDDKDRPPKNTCHIT